MKTKHFIAILVAIIGAVGLIVAALITGIFGLINTSIGNDNTTESRSAKIESSQPEPTPNIAPKEDALNIHPILPNPQKPPPKSVFEHNLKAKNLLDRSIKIPDKEIKTLLDNIFSELNKSLSEDEEYGETYYFLGVASCKRGDYYIAINEVTKKAVDAYTDSIHYFDKSEFIYSHRSNVLFDRGKSYTALGDIYSNSDSEVSKEYYQKAIDNFNHALDGYLYPENIYFAIASIHQKMKEYQKAIVCYTNALKTANDQYKPTKMNCFLNGQMLIINSDWSTFIKKIIAMLSKIIRMLLKIILKTEVPITNWQRLFVI